MNGETNTEKRLPPPPRRWARVPTGLYRLGLTYEQAAMASILLSYCRPPENLQCWPGLRTLTKALGLTPSKKNKVAVRITDELVSFGLVSVFSRRSALGQLLRCYDLTNLWVHACEATVEVEDQPDPHEGDAAVPKEQTGLGSTSERKGRRHQGFGKPKYDFGEGPGPAREPTPALDLRVQRFLQEFSSMKPLPRVDLLQQWLGSYEAMSTEKLAAEDRLQAEVGRHAAASSDEDYRRKGRDALVIQKLIRFILEERGAGVEKHGPVPTTTGVSPNSGPEAQQAQVPIAAEGPVDRAAFMARFKLAPEQQQHPTEDQLLTSLCHWLRHREDEKYKGFAGKSAVLDEGRREMARLELGFNEDGLRARIRALSRCDTMAVFSLAHDLAEELRPVLYRLQEEHLASRSACIVVEPYKAGQTLHLDLGHLPG